MAEKNLSSDLKIEQILDCGLLIRLTGPCAQIPSSSNTHVIARCGRRLTIRKSDRTLNCLAELTALWTRTIYQDGKSPPSFGNTPVRIFIVHAKKPRRFDSHNVPKAVCDWLQARGVIEDDTHAECFCIKAQDYPDQCNQDETTITIMPRAKSDLAWERAFFGETNDGFF